MYRHTGQHCNCWYALLSTSFVVFQDVPNRRWYVSAASLPATTLSYCSPVATAKKHLLSQILVEPLHLLVPSVHGDIVAGGGPCGLAAAMYLSRMGWRDIEVWDKLEHPRPSNDGLWGTGDRSYNIGITDKGKKALRELGVYDRVVKCCAPIMFRQEWSPQNPEGKRTSEVLPGGRDPTQVLHLPRRPRGAAAHTLVAVLSTLGTASSWHEPLVQCRTCQQSVRHVQGQGLSVQCR